MIGLGLSITHCTATPFNATDWPASGHQQQFVRTVEDVDDHTMLM